MMVGEHLHRISSSAGIWRLGPVTERCVCLPHSTGGQWVAGEFCNPKINRSRQKQIGNTTRTFTVLSVITDRWAVDMQDMQESSAQPGVAKNRETLAVSQSTETFPGAQHSLRKVPLGAHRKSWLSQFWPLGASFFSWVEAGAGVNWKREGSKENVAVHKCEDVVLLQTYQQEFTDALKSSETESWEVGQVDAQIWDQWFG